MMSLYECVLANGKNIVLFVCIISQNVLLAIVEGGRRGSDPEIPGLKTLNPEVPNLKKFKSRHPEIRKKNFQIPKGSIPKFRAFKHPIPTSRKRSCSPPHCRSTSVDLQTSLDNILYVIS